MCGSSAFYKPEAVKMCGSMSAISLQVLVTLMLLSRLQGKVLAPSHLQAMAGLPFMLACNITMETGEALKQVHWLDMTNKTILHYQPDKYEHVTKVDGIELSQQIEGQQAHTSVITIKRAGPANEGCYQCLFDVYPSGQQRGRTCLSLTAKVELMDNKTVVSGKPVTFLCKYILSKRVRQVLWKKTAEQGDTATVASYVNNDSPSVDTAFKGRVTLNPSLGQSKLSIHQAQTEDEGCYTCEFHTYPDGIKSATACLSVYVLPKPEASYVTVSQGIVEANCSALSRPAAEISWNVEGHNQTLGPAVTSFYQLGDGTTMVVSTIQLQTELLDDELVKCEVRHQGLVSAIYVTLNKPSCVALVLLICLCICLKRC
ncbi:OX-2 membrane glycoprotein-like isoform X3 [Ctenopharyngodon idella]|uniref:OX-2 membrane glycoprotein-like isoform X3 n=1 Tax=Ctenopharyngodon idella TaxID=7959 RepID=UPI0022307CB7|nr:OX-2 membrane glycoprotein-like isoform X3 [Ctenopharyngodon idella]XP_051751825.1 OX-2 membrane glycoprotein-like isoform X3 [Ctenopharyngodon idella]XP_051751832.1 OX-2 membrane glycoprotein-like isoform X3 [Ctenopharyngodon idella]